MVAQRATPTPTTTPTRTAETTVVIVDDSPVVRQLVERALAGQRGVAVIGQANDGREALATVRALEPDAVILDLEMPVMDGYETLTALEGGRHRPDVIVFANIEPEDLSAATARVRSAGARLVVKPVDLTGVDDAVAHIRRRLLDALGPAATAPPVAVAPRSVDAVVIASSTGGPSALEAVLTSLPSLPVPVFVVQHIASEFSARLAARLDGLCPFPVVEAGDGEPVEAGTVYVGPSGLHLAVERSRHHRDPVIRLRDLPPVNSCLPSADVLFQSSAEVYGPNQLGLVLTGIGQDGLDGCRVLAAHGAPIVVQDEATSVVWGMPGAVADAGLAGEILPLDQIGPHLTRAMAPGRARSPRGGLDGG